MYHLNVVVVFYFDREEEEACLLLKWFAVLSPSREYDYSLQSVLLNTDSSWTLISETVLGMYILLEIS